MLKSRLNFFQACLQIKLHVFIFKICIVFNSCKWFCNTSKNKIKLFDWGEPHMTNFLFSWSFGDTTRKYKNAITCYELQQMATYLVACARKYLLSTFFHNLTWHRTPQINKYLMWGALSHYLVGICFCVLSSIIPLVTESQNHEIFDFGFAVQEPINLWSSKLQV